MLLFALIVKITSVVVGVLVNCYLILSSKCVALSNLCMKNCIDILGHFPVCMKVYALSNIHVVAPWSIHKKLH